MADAKRAFITGITGQDGSYLAELLLSQGYEVHGMVRRTSTDSLVRIPPQILPQVTLHWGSMHDAAALARILKLVQPDEIYNLAAQSHVGISFDCPVETTEINYHGLGRLVHAVLESTPSARIYQASTSEMFGSTAPPQNERSEMAPVSPYAIAKLRAYEDYVVGYRARHGLHISSGILFNHESPRRGREFVTRKIALALAAIKLGLQHHLELGNLRAQRDWGYAKDYVEAMYLMVQKEVPADFVIGTGESHTVKEFVDAAAQALDLSLFWEGEQENEVARDAAGIVRVRVSSQFYRPAEVHALRADPSKAGAELGWHPKTSFSELVEMMVRSDYDALSGESQKRY
ncbi:GDP-mannose 4,6-dehydratase [Patescibacteria group bacterium]|nr:GDP-mannose 4,6-dehydratase [Patescibacteria group bacterium]